MSEHKEHHHHHGAYESEYREPLINGLDKNYTKITDDLVAPTETNSLSWWIATLITGAGAAFFVFCLAWTVDRKSVV